MCIRDRRITTNRVEHDIDLFCYLFESLRLVVDADISAQFFQIRLILGRSSGEHPRALPLGQLNSHGPNSAGTAVNEDGLPLLELGGVEERLPRSQRGKGNPGGLGV